MGNILRAEVRIRGTRPLLWHTFGPESLPLERPEKTGVAGNDPEEWKKTFSADGAGRLFVENSYVFGTIRDGAKNVKKGRGSIQAAVASTLQVEEDRIFTNRTLPEGEPPRDPEAEVYLDVRSVRNPATRARNIGTELFGLTEHWGLIHLNGARGRFATLGFCPAKQKSFSLFR